MSASQSRASAWRNQSAQHIIRLVPAAAILSLGSGAAIVAAEPAVVLLVLLVLVLGGTILTRLSATDGDLFDPLIVVSLGYVFYFVVGPLYLLRNSSWLGYIVPVFGPLVCAIVGFGAFLGGFLSFRPPLPTLILPRHPNVRQSRLIRYSLLLLIAGVLAHLLSRVVAALTVRGILGMVELWIQLSPLLALAYALERERRSSLVIFGAILGATFLVMVFLVGTERRTVLAMAVPLVAYWHYRKGRLRLWHGGVVVLALLVSIFVLKFQQVMYDYPFEAWSLDLLAELIRYNYFHHGALFGTIRAFDVVTAIHNLSAIISEVPDTRQYLFGLSYAKPLLALVPRELWAHKPLPVTILVRELSGLTRVSKSQPLTMLGEMYWNFGYGGVVFGMAAFGAICRILFKYIGDAVSGSESEVFRLLLYAATVPHLIIQFRGGVHAVVLWYSLAVWLPLWVGERYYFGRS